MKQISSEITISPEAPRSKIGTPLGEHGLATQSSSAVSTWLARQRPADMDKAAVSRARSHGVGLAVRYEGRYPTGANGERLPSYVVAVGCGVDGDEQSRSAALADLRNFMTPAAREVVEDWLAELSVMCAARQRDQLEASLMLEAYTSRLMQYPADVVKDALLVKPWKFFPTWGELQSYCEQKTSPRRCMIAALEQKPKEAEEQCRPATAEEKARIQALVDELFPNQSQAMREAAVREATKGSSMKGVFQ